MAERDAIVVESRPGLLRLQPLGKACRDCGSGCGGRCSLFPDSECFDHPLSAAEVLPVAGARVRIAVDDRSLRQAAWLGYGRVWLGLLLGAAAGHGLGVVLGQGQDLLAFAGLLLGTSVAALSSKPAVPALRLLPESDPPDNPVAQFPRVTIP